MPIEERIRDRRHTARIPVGFPVELQDLDFVFRCTAIDLAPGGVRVRAQPVPEVGLDVDVTLRPPGQPPLKVHGRVAHASADSAGIAFAVDKPGVYEAVLGLYEMMVMSEPSLAIRLKQRPTSLFLSARIYPRPLGTAPMSGAEHWLHSLLKPQGTTIAELKAALGSDWGLLAHVPFSLIERGVAGLTPMRVEADEEPAAGLGGTPRRR
jgi:hypothetical protein